MGFKRWVVNTAIYGKKYGVPLKTHFGLHNPLMTLSSLEIGNSWCLMPVLQVGACGGVTESAKFGMIQLADCFILPKKCVLLFFCVQTIIYEGKHGKPSN